MPYINFTNVENEIVNDFSENKLGEFSKLSSASLENIFIIQTNNKIVNHNNVAFVHIMWLPRDVEVENNVNMLLNEFFAKYDYERVCVYFTNMEKEHYYVGEL